MVSLLQDLRVLDYKVNYMKEFVPSDEGCYTITVSNGKKMNFSEGAIINNLNNEHKKIVFTNKNSLSKKKTIYVSLQN